MSGTLFSQKIVVTNSLILSDSLYNINSSPYKFIKHSGGFGYSVDISEVQNINDYVKIENDQLKVSIRYGGGCGKSSAKLVYNGISYQDKTKNSYYILKLLFISDDDCAALKTEQLLFDISALKNHKIRFYGFDQFID